jgi:2-dehydropantoate 2-reductase
LQSFSRAGILKTGRAQDRPGPKVLNPNRDQETALKIAVLGAGGVGGYFGGRLAAAGANLTFIARGEHLSALRRDGLRIESALGNALVKPVRVTDDPAPLGPVDMVWIAVKLWSTDEAARAVAPLVGPRTAVISFQNGVEAEDLLIRLYGRERVMGGVAHIAAVIEQPGVIRHNGTLQKLAFGELDGIRSERAEALLALCRKAGIDAAIPEDINRAIWEKFVFLVGLSGMTALTRLPIGPVREDPDTRAMLLEVLREAAAVARAKGVALAEDAAERQLAFTYGLPPTMISSMLGDLRRGNRLELPWLAGAVVRLGRQLGVATPMNAAVYAALKPYVGGALPQAGSAAPAMAGST